MKKVFSVQFSVTKREIFSFLRTVLCGICLFVLCSCGSTATVDNSGLVQHTGIGYQVKIPASWEVVDNTKITTPTNGKIELAVRSLVDQRGFMNNLFILSDTLQANASASEYVRQSMLEASREYLSLTVVNEEQIVFDDGASSRLEIFHAKYNDVTEERLFMQTARICGKKVYLMTLGLDNTTTSDNYARYKTMLASFICK